MIPHGEQIDRAQSGCIEGQVSRIEPRKDDIERVLILLDNVDKLDLWALAASPVEHALQRFYAGEFVESVQDPMIG